jgi:hypothetical protein
MIEFLCLPSAKFRHEALAVLASENDLKQIIGQAKGRRQQQNCVIEEIHKFIFKFFRHTVKNISLSRTDDDD